MNQVTITAISDTHAQVALPDLLKGYESDILVHCGDFTAGQTNRMNRSSIYDSHRQSWQTFLLELKSIRHQFGSIIVVPGNHDQICEYMSDQCKSEMANIGANLLINSGVNVLLGEPVKNDKTRSLSFWGVPHTPPFYSWFFQGYDMAMHANNIAAATNVLICHGPPYSILDTVGPVPSHTLQTSDHLGCRELFERCQNLPNLKAVFFGHIHSSHGEDHRNGVNYFNCSILGERYERRYHPITTSISLNHECNEL
ncbi:MAG: metallophosphoesterase [Bacteroidetes bacterium]|nr:metallophosphoesterase [Bacteroidota bacterium]